MCHSPNVNVCLSVSCVFVYVSLSDCVFPSASISLSGLVQGQYSRFLRLGWGCRFESPIFILKNHIHKYLSIQYPFMDSLSLSLDDCARSSQFDVSKACGDIINDKDYDRLAMHVYHFIPYNRDRTNSFLLLRILVLVFNFFLFPINNHTYFTSIMVSVGKNVVYCNIWQKSWLSVKQFWGEFFCQTPISAILRQKKEKQI